MPFDGKQSESSVTHNLRTARDLIARGWCAGLRASGDNFCAIGAVGMAVHRNVWMVGSEAPEIVQLAKFATFVGRDEANRTTVTHDSFPIERVAGHNNVLGKDATLQMFDNAIGDSVRQDMEALV